MVEKIRQVFPRLANSINTPTDHDDRNDEIKTALQVKIFG